MNDEETRASGGGLTGLFAAAMLILLAAAGYMFVDAGDHLESKAGHVQRLKAEIELLSAEADLYQGLVEELDRLKAEEEGR